MLAARLFERHGIEFTPTGCDVTRRKLWRGAACNTHIERSLDLYEER